MSKQKDNQTLNLKAALRVKMLRFLPDPIVLETHGGTGRIFLRCYSNLAPGVVFETDEEKTSYLAVQRPAWAIYQADCERSIRAGVGFHVRPNFFDLDPYGQPWPILDAILANKLPDLWASATNDGLRMKLQSRGGWNVSAIQDAIRHFGNERIYSKYLEACRWMIERRLSAARFRLDYFTGYYCGKAQHMTHWAFVARRECDS